MGAGAPYNYAFARRLSHCERELIPNGMTPHVANTQTETKRRLHIPLPQGLFPVDFSKLGPDVVAGITLAALGIPEVMGYAKIIGTPVITGLYTLFLPVIVFAIFGSSRHLVVSADSATAAMVAAFLAGRAIMPSAPGYVELTCLVALASGVFLALARILRLGFLADFLSRTVLVGFLTGVGIQVAASEIHAMLGIETGGRGFAGQLIFVVRHLDKTYLPNLFISLGVLAVIFACDRFAPRVPGGLLAVIGMIAASALLHWGQRGVHTIGFVPGGLPHIGLPRFGVHDLSLIMSVSFSCFIVILAQSAATSRAYAVKYGESFSEDKDLVGLSLANVAAGCSGTFVVNGSPTKTAIVDGAGGKSQWANLTAAMAVLVVLLFLTKPLGFLPEAVLAAIVFVIGVKLIDVPGLRDILRWNPREFVLALITTATVVAFGVERGLLLAVILSLLMHVRQSYRPHSGVVVRGEKDEWEIDDAEPGKFVEPGMVMFWFGAGLFYANAAYFTGMTRRLVDEASGPVRWFVIDARAITEVDYSGGRAIVDFQQYLERAGVVLALILVETRPQRALERMGFADLIGRCRIFDSRSACVEAYRSERSAMHEAAEDARRC